MTDFEEYIKQGEPEKKKEKSRIDHYYKTKPVKDKDDRKDVLWQNINNCKLKNSYKGTRYNLVPTCTKLHKTCPCKV